MGVGCRVWRGSRKVDARLPGKRHLNSHFARPVHLIITMIKWIRTSRLAIKNSLSGSLKQVPKGRRLSCLEGRVGVNRGTSL